MATRVSVIGALLVLIAAKTIAQPSPSLGNKDSLEWAAEDSSLVVRGRIVALRPSDRYGYGVAIVTLRIEEAIKGSSKSEVEFSVMDDHHGGEKSSVLQPRMDGKKEVLAFLAESKRLENEIPDLMRYASYATHSGKILGSIMELDNHADVQAISMDFRLLSKPSEILSRTKAAVKWTSNEPRMYRLLPPPIESDAALPRSWQGMPVLLAVPADSRLESLAHKWLKSGNWEWRLRGVDALEPFPSQGNVSLVKKLIADAQVPKDPDGRLRYIRNAANRLLDGWAEKSKTLEVIIPDPPGSTTFCVAVA